ncbi:hypothetical protein OS493_033632, partial [Desmophyllum pertusum]
RSSQLKEKAENPDNKCSAANNISKAAMEDIGCVDPKRWKDFQVILHYHHEAIKGLCTAYNRSEDVNSAQWRSEVLGTLSLRLQEVIHPCDTFPVDLKILKHCGGGKTKHRRLMPKSVSSPYCRHISYFYHYLIS